MQLHAAITSRVIAGSAALLLACTLILAASGCCALGQACPTTADYRANEREKCQRRCTRDHEGCRASCPAFQRPGRCVGECQVQTDECDRRCTGRRK